VTSGLASGPTRRASEREDLVVLILPGGVLKYRSDSHGCPTKYRSVRDHRTTVMVITNKFLKNIFTGYREISLRHPPARLCRTGHGTAQHWMRFASLSESGHCGRAKQPSSLVNRAQKARNITLELTAGVKDGNEIDTVTSFNARSVALEFRLQVKPCISS
jgi:hypothetical protein